MTVQNYSSRFNNETFAWKPIANKTSSDNIILVKPLSGVLTKAFEHYVTPDFGKKPDLVF